MKSKKRMQNLRDARTHFNWDFTKDDNERFNVHRIDKKMFDLGMEAGLDTSVPVIPDKYKDNSSFVEGFNRAKRLLKVNSDLYDMGMQCYFKGIDEDNIPPNNKNNEYFMSGYNNAKNIGLENENLHHHSRR